MKLAIHFMNFTLPASLGPLPKVLSDTAHAAEEAGVDTMTLMDHWFQMERPGRSAEEPMLDGYTGLGFLAGQTSTLKLGLAVTGVTYRYPGLLAKTIATLDVLSGGRAFLGVGAAWYEREHRGLGVPFPPTAERFERLEEAILICKQMWSDDDGPFDGTHYQLAETICNPRPIQRPRPPILIGGMGEQKTLRLVARHADACNLFGTDPAVIATKLDALRRHCVMEGRDYDTIEKTIMGGTDPAVDEAAFLREMEAMAKLGVTKVWNGPAGDDPAAWVATTAAKMVPRLAQIG